MGSIHRCHAPRSWLNTITGLLRQPPPKATPGKGRRRVLRFESLEGRSMLSVTLLPTISGTVFHDLNQNGVNNNEPGLPGVTLNLYRDGGNGVFDGTKPGGDDQFVAATQTDANGNYHFSAVPVGTYFVQQLPTSGLGACRGKTCIRFKSPRRIPRLCRGKASIRSLPPASW